MTRTRICVWSFIVYSLGALPPAILSAGETYSAGDHKIEVTLAPEKPAVLLGEPTWLEFTVHNRSDTDLQIVVGGNNRNRLGRSDYFKIKTTDTKGNVVAQPDSGPSFGGIEGLQKLPARGSYTYKLFLPHWATFSEPGKYEIVARRALRLSNWKSEDWSELTPGEGLAVEARAKIEILPTDAKQLGQLIDAYGAAMLKDNSEAAETATKMLAAIDDERVIPYCVKALQTDNYTKKFSALGMLGKFKSDEAFEGLKQGMNTTGEEIGSATNISLAYQLAENIRHAAAASLATSPHPEAIPFLISRRGDASVGVRVTVLHELGKMKPADAIPILQEMTSDPEEIVRDEAARYLKLQQAAEEKE